MRRFLIWSYNASAAGLFFGKVSDDTKVAYSIGAIVGATVAAAQTAFVLTYLDGASS